MATPAEVAAELVKETDVLVEAYCCSLCSMMLANAFLTTKLEENRDWIDQTVGLTTEDMKPQNEYLFVTPIKGELLKGPGEDGVQVRILGRMVMLMIYELWERRFRGEFADAHGVAVDEIQSNTFGDLRYFRNCIIHNGGICDRDLSQKLKLLPPQDEGDEVQVGFLGIMFIRQAVYRACEELQKSTKDSRGRDDSGTFMLRYFSHSDSPPWMVMAWKPIGRVA